MPLLASYLLGFFRTAYVENLRIGNSILPQTASLKAQLFVVGLFLWVIA
jgi:hypothetical protein